MVDLFVVMIFGMYPENRDKRIFRKLLLKVSSQFNCTQDFVGGIKRPPQTKPADAL